MIEVIRKSEEFAIFTICACLLTGYGILLNTFLDMVFILDRTVTKGNTFACIRATEKISRKNICDNNLCYYAVFSHNVVLLNCIYQLPGGSDIAHKQKQQKVNNDLEKFHWKVYYECRSAIFTIVLKVFNCDYINQGVFLQPESILIL